MEPDGSLPFSQEHSTGLFSKPQQRIHPNPSLFVTFRNKLIFYCELLTPGPTTQLEGHR
jgi:hypothetical protein